jgi:hypothetical protein
MSDEDQGFLAPPVFDEWLSKLTDQINLYGEGYLRGQSPSYDLLVKKSECILSVPNELLRDIQGTSPIRHAKGKGITSTSWKRRFRWWLNDRRYRLAVWLFENVSREGFPDRDDW